MSITVSAISHAQYSQSNCRSSTFKIYGKMAAHESRVAKLLKRLAFNSEVFFQNAFFHTTCLLCRLNFS